MIRQYLAFCLEQRIDAAGIEFVQGRDGRRYTYDVNMNTNYNGGGRGGGGCERDGCLGGVV